MLGMPECRLSDRNSSLEYTMRVTERILEEVSKLPEPLQAEVLDFAQFLASKVSREAKPKDEPSLTNVSLSLAMHGMEDEDVPAYSLDDLKQVF